MQMAVSKLITIIIVVIVVVATILFLLSGKGAGLTLIEGEEIRACCDKYKANDCDWSIRDSIWCNDDDSLGTLVEGNFNEDQLSDFCNCPIIVE